MLLLGRLAAEKMMGHAEEDYPREACGLLLGAFDERTRIRKVLEARPAGNLDRRRPADRFSLDPADFLRIDREARERGQEVVGVYHSHPDHPAVPSETDRARAGEIWGSLDSWSYVILEVNGGGVASWRSWVMRDGRFHEEPSRIEESPGADPAADSEAE